VKFAEVFSLKASQSVNLLLKITLFVAIIDTNCLSAQADFERKIQSARKNLTNYSPKE
jgi:hypothetical protein